MENLAQLREIVRRLRAPDGCPWDREQTSASLIPTLIEELYEVVDTIERADSPHLREELGDLLLHIMMQVQIAEESSLFTLDDVLKEICAKLIRRHPHVFGDVRASDTATVLKQWEEIKRAEKGNSAEKHSVLSGVPTSFPALLRAMKLQGKAAKVGFDWPVAEPVFAKIDEEIAEIHEAVAMQNPAAIEDEIGDLLFTVVNLARKLNVEPELALQRASNKFTRRFEKMEETAAETAVSLRDLSLEQLDAHWISAKDELQKL